jgi:Flp pilus assembly pilin Flp
MPALQSHRPRGQSSAEYALLLVLVAVIVVLVFVVLSGGISRAFQKVADTFGSPASISVESTSQPSSTAEAPATSEASSPATPAGQTGSSATAVPTTGASDTGNSGSGDTPVIVNPDDTSTTNRYYDQFDGSGNIHWTNLFGTWVPNKQVFISSNNYAKVIGDISFPNYDFSTDVQTVKTMGSNIWDVTMVLFRVKDANNFYAIMIKADGVVELAANRNGQWQGWISVTATKLSPFDNHTFRVKAFGDHIQVFIDNRKEVDYRDPSPILSGGIGFTNNNSIGQIDNVEVDRRAQG